MTIRLQRQVNGSQVSRGVGLPRESHNGFALAMERSQGLLERQKCHEPGETADARTKKISDDKKVEKEK